MVLGAVTSEVAGVRWALPLRSSSDRSTEGNTDIVRLNAAWRLIDETPLEFPKIPKDFIVSGGEQTDSEAAPVPTYNGHELYSQDEQGRGRLDLGGGQALLIDHDRGEIALHVGGETVPVWGEARPDVLAAAASSGAASFSFQGGTLTLEARRSPDHADAWEPSRIDIETPERSLSLRAADRSDPA